MKQYLRKADIILFIVLICLGLALSAVFALSGDAPSNAHVVIKSGGELYATYPLSGDKTLRVPAPGDSDGYNIVEIKDGKVSVSEASCKNQICVKHGAISSEGESIICLPNRLIVTVEGKTEGGSYDSITS